MILSKPHLDPKTKRLTTLTESHSTIDPFDPIDQCTPHQLVVSHILGAILCHPALRIIRTDDRSRPYVTLTDMLANLRGAADLAVSLDGSFDYGLLIEVKTIATWKGPLNLTLFNHVTSEAYHKGRNKAQLERLVKGTPFWWYIIVDYSRLKAKTHSEHVRAILDCPALFVEGTDADTRAIDHKGFKTLSDLLDEMHEKILKLGIGKAKPLPTPYYQMNLLPMDDVPVVTMDDPLRQPVVAPVAEVKVKVKPAPDRNLPNENFILLIEALKREIELLGGIDVLLSHLPQGTVTTFNRLKTMSGEQLISEYELNRSRAFVKHGVYLTESGILGLAWRLSPSAGKRFVLAALPTMRYFFTSSGLEINLLTSVSKHCY